VSAQSAIISSGQSNSWCEFIALDRPTEVISTAALVPLGVEYLELADQIAEDDGAVSLRIKRLSTQSREGCPKQGVNFTAPPMRNPRVLFAICISPIRSDRSPDVVGAKFHDEMNHRPATAYDGVGYRPNACRALRPYSATKFASKRISRICTTPQRGPGGSPSARRSRSLEEESATTVSNSARAAQRDLRSLVRLLDPHI
jgi:hypothetical protein